VGTQKLNNDDVWRQNWWGDPTGSLHYTDDGATHIVSNLYLTSLPDPDPDNSFQYEVFSSLSRAGYSLSTSSKYSYYSVLKS
jgi:hypothetical protein